MRNVLRTKLKLTSVTQSSVTSGSGISGQSVPGSVVVEQDTGRDIVQRGRNVELSETFMSRNAVTPRGVQVFDIKIKLRS